MFETTISYLAWIVVVLVQAVVHIWIFGTPRNRVDDRDALVVAAVKRDDPNENNNNINTSEHDQSIPQQTIPHMQISEDEFEEEQEQESFDGDEPLIFFELLEKTGSELMQSCSSLENLVQEQLIKVDAVTEALSLNGTHNPAVD